VSIGLRVRTGITRDGQITIPYTQISVHLTNPRKIFLRIVRKGGARKTEKIFGVPNMPVGDSEVDRQFDVKGLPHEFLPGVFATRQSFRKRLLDLDQKRSLEIELDGSELRFEQQGLEADADQLQSLLEMLMELVEAIELGR
jgi:hypothetical protein